MTHFYKWQCKNPFSYTRWLKIIKNVSFWNFKHTTIDLNHIDLKWVDHNQKWDFVRFFKTLCITSICRWVHCAKQWWNSMTLATILCPTFEKCHHYYCSRDRGSAETSIGSLMSCKNYLENELIIYWMMARH